MKKHCCLYFVKEQMPTSLLALSLLNFKWTDFCTLILTPETREQCVCKCNAVDYGPLSGEFTLFLLSLQILQSLFSLIYTEAIAYKSNCLTSEHYQLLCGSVYRKITTHIIKI